MQVGMVAGEASGDLLASLLLGGLRQRWPALDAAGIGGPLMRAQGLQAWWPSDALAVRGYVEVLRHLRRIKAIRDRLAERLLARRPQVFVGVDAPDFNLGLERRLKAAGIKTVHFVCPSVWAWRGGRAKTFAASVDHMLCLFPFEPALLARHGVAATYVGHPLADAIPLEPPRAAARAALGLRDDETVVALLPGSRRSEIEQVAPAFMQTAARLARLRPRLRFVLPAAPGLAPLLRLHLTGHASGVDIRLLDGPSRTVDQVGGPSHAALAACDAALVASGTATLEAALFKRPLVVGYRMAAVSWQIMKRMNYLPWVGLPNILCGELVVPELLQQRCEPAALADAVLRWLDDPAAVRALQARFVDLHQLLRRDTARLATDAIAQVVAAA